MPLCKALPFIAPPEEYCSQVGVKRGGRKITWRSVRSLALTLWNGPRETRAWLSRMSLCPLSRFCGSLFLQLDMSVLQICRCSPPSFFLVLCPAKMEVNLPALAQGAKVTGEATRGVSVGSPGGGSSFTSTRSVARAPARGHAGLHGRSCGFTSPRKAASQGRPPAPGREFVWGWLWPPGKHLGSSPKCSGSIGLASTRKRSCQLRRSNKPIFVGRLPCVYRGQRWKHVSGHGVRRRKISQ